MKEVKELSCLLKQHFFINAARITLIAQMVIALIKVRTVCLSEVGGAFAGNALISSNEKRIHRFLKDFHFDQTTLCRFVCRFLPEGQWIIALDRTVWEFGNQKINILMLAAVYKGVAIPLMWKMLTKNEFPKIGKKGNSNTQERIELMQEFIRLFGKQRIEAVCADREFIGNEWFGWLREEGIPVYIRVKDNLYASDSRGHDRKISHLFRDLKIGQARTLKGKRQFGNVSVWISGMRLPDWELLIVVCFDRPETALETYAKRWQIETMFACLKSRGFRFESTHLKDPERISRLLAIVCIAFVWAYIIGDQLEHLKPLKVKKHGFRAKSIFRYGFDHIRKLLLNITDCFDEFEKSIQLFDITSRIIFVR